MNEETTNVVNDTQEPNVEVQEPVVTETVEDVQETPVEGAESEVITDQQDKKPQSREENANAAKIRKEATKAAEDKVYADLYSKDYNIHSKADYEKARAKQKEKNLVDSIAETEDPSDVINQLKEQWEKNDPRLQEYERIKKENYTRTQLEDLNVDLKDMGLDAINSLDDIAELPNADAIKDYIVNGQSLPNAYFLANRKEIITQKAEKAQKLTLSKINGNANAPGSLADNSNTDTMFTEAQVDAMTQGEVNKNLDMITKSMKTWK